MYSTLEQRSTICEQFCSQPELESWCKTVQASATTVHCPCGFHHVWGPRTSGETIAHKPIGTFSGNNVWCPCVRCGITAGKKFYPLWNVINNVNFSEMKEHVKIQLLYETDTVRCLKSDWNQEYLKIQEIHRRFCKVKCHMTCGTGTSYLLQLKAPHIWKWIPLVKALLVPAKVHFVRSSCLDCFHDRFGSLFQLMHRPINYALQANVQNQEVFLVPTGHCTGDPTIQEMRWPGTMALTTVQSYARTMGPGLNYQTAEVSLGRIVQCSFCFYLLFLFWHMNTAHIHCQTLVQVFWGNWKQQLNIFLVNNLFCKQWLFNVFHHLVHW